MNVPNVKDVLQKLRFLKSNTALLVPIIIALVAIVLFIPNQLLSSKLERQIEQQSIATAQRLRRASSDVVPAAQSQQEARQLGELAQDANQIAELAKQTTQRELLSYELFPEPNETSAFIFDEFGRAFRTSIDDLLSEVNAKNCPTDAELERSLQHSPLSSGRGGRSASTRSMRSILAGGALHGYGRTGRLTSTILDEVCRERAKSAGVYVDTSELSGYDFWGAYEYTGVDKAVEDCWYWQLGNWVAKDVIDSIAQVNSGSDSVLTAPVKRLMNLGFSLTARTARRPTRFRQRVRRKTEADTPAYVLSAAEGLAEPCTGRYCDEDIDVLHFRFAVVIDSDMVMPFIQELCSAKNHTFKGYLREEPAQTFKHNQITVLEMDVSSVDRKGPAHYFYRYGEEAVVELDLICEYVFNKAGYEEIKPEAIKKTLQGETQTDTR